MEYIAFLLKLYPWIDELLIGTTILFFSNIFKNNIKKILGYFINYFIYEIRINKKNSDKLYKTLTKYIQLNYSNSIKKRRINEYDVNDNEEIDTITLPLFSDFVYITKNNDIIDGYGERNLDEYFIIKTLFKLSFIDNFIEKVNKYSIITKKQKYVYISDGIYFDALKKLPSKNIDSIIFEDNIIKDLKSDIDNFVENEQWYNDRDIAYKRTYLLYGKHGNGKSSLMIALANYTNRNIYFISLNDISSEKDLFKLVNRVSNKKVIFVFEDVDTYISNNIVKKEDDIEIKDEEFDTIDTKNRETINKNISFSAILNIIDGAISPHNTIFIITTNYKDDLDSAFLRRMDYQIEYKNPNKEMVEKYLTHFYQQKITLKRYNKDIPYSELQNYCIKYSNNLNKLIELIQE